MNWKLIDVVLKFETDFFTYYSIFLLTIAPSGQTGNQQHCECISFTSEAICGDTGRLYVI